METPDKQYLPPSSLLCVTDALILSKTIITTVIHPWAVESECQSRGTYFTCCCGPTGPGADGGSSTVLVRGFLWRWDAQTAWNLSQGGWGHSYKTKTTLRSAPVVWCNQATQPNPRQHQKSGVTFYTHRPCYWQDPTVYILWLSKILMIELNTDYIKLFRGGCSHRLPENSIQQCISNSIAQSCH